MTLRHALRSTLVLAAIGAVGLAGAAPAAAAPAAGAPAHFVQQSDNGKDVDVKGGETRLRLTAPLENLFEDENIALALVGDAKIKKDGSVSRFAFPIKDGKINATTLKADIEHRGGIKLSEGGDELVLSDFIVKTEGTGKDKKNVLTARVNNTDTRIDFLTVELGRAEVTVKDNVATTKPIRARLTDAAAKALNDLFDLDLKKGAYVGSVTLAPKI